MGILLSALIFVLPLLILPGVLFHYDVTPKILILSFCVAASLLFAKQTAEGIAALWARRTGRWLCLLAGMQVFWYAIATATSSRVWFSVFGSNWRRMGLVTMIALSLLVILAAAQISREPGSLRTMLRAFACAAIIASAYGILQYFDIDPLQNPSGYHAQAGDSTIVRPPGPLGQADYFAWWLAIAVFGAITLARIETGWWRRTAFAASVLSSIAIVLSGTRSAMLAVIAGFIAMIALSGWKPRKQHVLTALACAALFVIFLISPAGTRLRARVRWSGNEPLGGARPLLWRDSLRMSLARPFTGFGPETFSAEFPRYQSVELARLFPDFYHESPHNLALDALTSAGIPGLVLVLGWGTLGFAAARRASPGPVSALAAALVASCVASVFVAAMAGPIFATLLVIAMLAASTPEDAPRRAVSSTTVVAISAPILAGLGLFAVLLTRTEFLLAKLQSSSADTSRAIALYAESARAALPGAGEDLYSSRRLATLCGTSADRAIQARCIQISQQAAARATDTSDNPPNAWYNLAMFSAEKNDPGKVESSLRTATEQAPNWFKPHWALANLLKVTGRPAEARLQAAQAFDLDAGKNKEVTRTVSELTQTAR
jgi:O-antigen ligase